MKTTAPIPKLTRTLLWIGGVLGSLLIVSIGLINFRTARISDVPSDLDYSTTRSSDLGLFKVSYTSSIGTVPVNQIHQWTLHVETADGNPVEDAAITVDGDMPQQVPRQW